MYPFKKQVFETLEQDLQQHNGKTFAILRPLNQQEKGEELNEMYLIKLSSGQEIHAYEEEIMDLELVEVPSTPIITRKLTSNIKNYGNTLH